MYLGYWWFFRYNTSPWRREVNCLPGLTFGGLSCHDHEGDWEGVTVILEKRDRRFEPVGAIYDAHGHGVRWAWQDLEVVKGRPTVYVAAGSHASYPAACTRPECDQKLSNSDFGDGGFGGERPWRYNSDDACETLTPEPPEQERRDDPSPTYGPCLVALPATYNALLDDPATDLDEGRRGVLWNAFPGRWGKARCMAIGRVCVQVNGPDSPSRQGRFTNPSDPDNDKKPDCGPRNVLAEYRRLQRRPAGGC